MKTLRPRTLLLGLVVSALPMSVLASGCSPSEPAPALAEHTGELAFPIVATGSSGTLYRLVAKFAVTGTAARTLTSDGAESVLSTELAPGEYDVRLQTGWKLYRQSPGTAGELVPMTSATLTSLNPAHVTVQAGAKSSVRFDFDVNGEDVSFGNGTVDVQVGFNDVPELVKLDLAGDFSVDGPNVAPIALRATALVDGRAVTSATRCAPVLAIAISERARPTRTLEAIYGAQSGSLCLDVGGGGAVLGGQAPAGSFVLTLPLLQPVQSLAALLTTASKSVGATLDVTLPPAGPLRYAGSLVAGPKAPADLACRPKACANDAGCPGSGQVCLAGQCVQKSFFCLDAMTEANARGDRRSCYGRRCAYATGSCVESPTTDADCYPGYALLAGECVPIALDVAAKPLPPFTSAPAAVCAKACGAGCGAKEICSSGYCYYAPAYCTGPITTRTFVPAAGTYVESSCGNYVCNAVNGECTTRCRTSDDCKPGASCDEGTKTCVAP
ncbi:MAG: hypothetical protein JST00_16220 [Deltaproteobacteria bacterium]|nr:hypothetical protein [Deltaproteobacteria bacterium]